MYANNRAIPVSNERLHMKPAPFTYHRPRDLDEAIALLARYEGEARPIAGGQSLLPMMAFRVVTPQLLVDLNALPDLGQITIDDQGVRLGSLVRWRDIETDARLAEAHPLLQAAISHVAHYQIRNRGTVGGSLAHADPSAEMPGMAMTCGAEIEIAGTGGRRIVKAKDFFVAALTTALNPDELIVSVRLPAWKAGRRWAFEEFARRKGDFALAGVALFYDQDAAGQVESINVGAIGVGDTPVRLDAVEQALLGRAIDLQAIRDAASVAMEAVEPPDDIHAPADYRRALLGTLLERALARAAGIVLPENQ
jgi:carbon-monoxide dehydrogenase medium subunit